MKVWKNLVLMSICICAQTLAQTPLMPEEPENISLDQVVVFVLERSPQLAAAEYESRIAAARIRQAVLRPPWMLNFELENFGGSGAANDFDVLEATFSVGRILELGNKADLRGEVAQNSKTLLESQQDVQRLELLSEAARRHVHLVTDQERLKLARDAVQLAIETQQAVQLRVSAGKTPVAEQRSAAIDVARSELQLEHAEHELLASRVRLSSLWGETAPADFKASGDLFSLPDVGDFTLLENLLDNNPELLTYASEQRLNAARISLAQSRARADIQFTGGLRYLALNDDVALVASASIPLGSRKRAESLLEASQLDSQRNPLLYEQRRLELYALLFEIYQELGHARTAVASLQTQIIPQASLALGDYQLGYAAGRYSLLELAQAQRVLLNARLEAVMAAADYHAKRIEIERLTGAVMNKGGRS